MPSKILAHLTWTTRERRPVIDRACCEFLEHFLPAAASHHGANVVAAGIVSDHVHLLLWLPSVIDVPRLVQALKGASSRIAARDKILKSDRLRWANGYDLRSVSPRRLPQAMNYVLGQAQRHPHLAIGPALKGGLGQEKRPERTPFRA